MRLRNVVAVAALSLLSCTGTPKPKFVEVATLLCEGLEDFKHLTNGVLSVHLLIERGDYPEALKVAYAVLSSFDESQDIEGVRELRALIFLLEGITKDKHELP